MYIKQFNTGVTKYEAEILCYYCQQMWTVTLCRVCHAHTWNHLKTIPLVRQSLIWNKRQLSAKQSRWQKLFDSPYESQFLFPRDNFWMRADAIAFAWSVGHWVQDVMFSHRANMLLCEVWFSQLFTQFPGTVYWQTSKQPLLSLV